MCEGVVMSKSLANQSANEFQSIILDGLRGGQLTLIADLNNFQSYTLQLPSGIGTAGQVLVSGGANAPLVWVIEVIILG